MFGLSSFELCLGVALEMAWGLGSMQASLAGYELVAPPPGGEWCSLEGKKVLSTSIKTAGFYGQAGGNGLLYSFFGRFRCCPGLAGASPGGYQAKGRPY